MRKYYDLICIFLLFPSVSFAQMVPREYFKMAKYHYDEGAYEQALEMVNKALELDSNYANAYYIRGRIYFDTEEYRHVLIDANRALDLTEKGSTAYAESLLLRGMTHHVLRQEEKAMIDVNESILISGSNPEAFLERARLKRAKSNYRGAIADLNHGIQLSQSKDAEMFATRALFTMEYYQPKWGDVNFDEMVADISRAISIAPDNYDYYQFRTGVFLNSGQKSRALEDLSTMITNFPDRHEAWSMRGLLMLQEAEYGKAVLDLTQSIKRDPTVEENYRYRALCFHNMGRLNEASRDLSAAINILANRMGESQYGDQTQIVLAEAYIQRGLCMTKMGNASGSCGDFQSAGDLGVRKGNYYYNKFCNNW